MPSLSIADALLVDIRDQRKRGVWPQTVEMTDARYRELLDQMAPDGGVGLTEEERAASRRAREEWIRLKWENRVGSSLWGLPVVLVDA